MVRSDAYLTRIFLWPYLVGPFWPPHFWKRSYAYGRMDEGALLNNNIYSDFCWFSNVHSTIWIVPWRISLRSGKSGTRIPFLLNRIVFNVSRRPIGKRSSASRSPSAVLHLRYRAFRHRRPLNNAAPPPAKRPWPAFRTTFLTWFFDRPLGGPVPRSLPVSTALPLQGSIRSESTSTMYIVCTRECWKVMPPSS